MGGTKMNLLPRFCNIQKENNKDKSLPHYMDVIRLLFHFVCLQRLLCCLLGFFGWQC